MKVISVSRRSSAGLAGMTAALCWAAMAVPAHAQDSSGGAVTDQSAEAPESTDQAADPTADAGSGSGTDLFSRSTFAVLIDGRAVIANGERNRRRSDRGVDAAIH